MKIRNISGQELELPALNFRVVAPGQVIEVAEDDVFGYTLQTTNWEPVDKPAIDVHEAAAAVEDAIIAVDMSGSDEPPAGNASQVAWVAYAVVVAGADRSEVVDMPREQIKDQFAPDELPVDEPPVVVTSPSDPDPGDPDPDDPTTPPTGDDTTEHTEA